jgi:hypothetical protein
VNATTFQLDAGDGYIAFAFSEKDPAMFPVRKPMTLAQFLTWEERQELRFEFDGVRPIERLSGTVAHAHIQTNLAVAIGGRLRASSCHFYGKQPQNTGSPGPYSLSRRIRHLRTREER